MAAPEGRVLLELRKTPASAGIGITLLAAGSAEHVEKHPDARGCFRLMMREWLLTPSLVNAHAHLDLTHMGPRPYDPRGGFVGWVDVVRRERAAEPERIAESVNAGIELSRRGGVTAVGDIAGCPATGPAARAGECLRDAGLSGVSFIEFFGIGKGRGRGLERALGCLDSLGRGNGGGAWRAGLQPHATNTVALDVYLRALEAGSTPISTHLAETPEEHRFVAEGSGPQRELLERIGVWDESVLESFGRGRTPIGHLGEVLGSDAALRRSAPIALVHVNDCSDRDLEVLAGLRRSGVNVHVVYCPRASEYFGAADHFGRHRYREMLEAGIPVALGTDSVINLGPELFRDGLSTLSELRLLARRDGVEWQSLLGMATVAGARAIGIDPVPYTFQRPRTVAGRPIPGLLAIRIPENSDNQSQIQATLTTEQAPHFLLDGTSSRSTES